MTGMCFTAATTSAIPSSRASPEKSHRRRPAVNRDQFHAGILQPRRQRRRDDARVVPPEPQLARQRRVRNRRPDSLHHPQRPIRIAQQRAAPIPLRDLVDRTPHINVDHIRPACLRPTCRLAQPVGIGPVQLHAQRAVRLVGRGQLHAPLVLPQHAFGTEQIGTSQSHAAAGARHQPKRQIAIPRDRREEEIRGELKFAQRQRANGDGGRVRHRSRTNPK